MSRSRLVAATLLVTLLAVAACHDDTPGNGPHPTGDTQQMQVMKLTDAQAHVKVLADDVAALVDAPLRRWTTQAAPCEDAAGNDTAEGLYTLDGTANVDLARDKQAATLHQIQDMWRRNGYALTEEIFPSGDPGGSVSAKVPASSLTISVTTTTDDKALAIIVATPCYHAAPGENPAES